MNITFSGTVKQVAFEKNDDGSVAAAIVKVEADAFHGGGTADLRITDTAQLAELVALQPFEAEVTKDGNAETTIQHPQKHSLTGVPISFSATA